MRKHNPELTSLAYAALAAIRRQEEAHEKEKAAQVDPAGDHVHRADPGCSDRSNYGDKLGLG